MFGDPAMEIMTINVATRGAQGGGAGAGTFTLVARFVQTDESILLVGGGKCGTLSCSLKIRSKSQEFNLILYHKFYDWGSASDPAGEAHDTLQTL